MNEVTDMAVKVNLGVVFRGDAVAITKLGKRIEKALAEINDLSLVFKQVSGSKLWIQEGEAPPSGT